MLQRTDGWLCIFNALSAVSSSGPGRALWSLGLPLVDAAVDIFVWKNLVRAAPVSG